jgi:hypothetical protein
MNLKSLFISTLLLTNIATTTYANNDFSESEKIDPWLFSPMSRFMKEDEWNDMLDEMHEEKVRKEKQERMFGRGKVVTIDTRDTKRCNEIRIGLERSPNVNQADLDKLCVKDDKNPYSSIVIVDDQYRMPISLDGLSPEQQKIVKQTRNFTALGVGAIGLLWMLPESVSKWDKDEITSTGLGNKWKENVKEGPVVDEDEWMINYIGHPVSGAAYYTVARHAGLGKWGSFGYSVFMSTIFWEYGFEAVAETPSIQDLIVTPIIGSLMGEAMYSMEQKIKENGGVLFGSEGLGGFAMALMNPAGAMLDGVNGWFEHDVLKSARTYIYTQPETGHSQDQNLGGGVIGIGVEFKF